MTELSYIMFSPDAKVESEHMILSNMPEHTSYSELENAFLSALTSEERTIFHAFCSSDKIHTRIFPLINFYPYHFAFAEKLRIGREIKNIVFVAKDTHHLHPLMLPSSESLREITNTLICDFNNSNGNDDETTYFTPESILAITHLRSYDSFVNAESKKTSYCDIQKLIDRVCESFSAKEFYSDIKFVLSGRGEDLNIIEIPRAPLVYVLCSVFALLHALSGDRVIKISTYKFAYASEITIETNTYITDKLPEVCTTLSDLAYDFPAISAIAQSATVVSILSEIVLSAEVDKEQDTLRVTIGAGFDYQSEPDFKFSDPYSDIDGIVNDALDIFDTIK